jgi:hypothetical protein
LGGWVSSKRWRIKEPAERPSAWQVAVLSPLLPRHTGLVYSQLLAYTLYRWEKTSVCNSVLGFVGRRPRQMCQPARTGFQQAATVIWQMLVLVEWISSGYTATPELYTPG